jgi:hypothetical protein
VGEALGGTLLGLLVTMDIDERGGAEADLIDVDGLAARFLDESSALLGKCGGEVVT